MVWVLGIVCEGFRVKGRDVGVVNRYSKYCFYLRGRKIISGGKRFGNERVVKCVCESGGRRLRDSYFFCFRGYL